MLGLAAACVLAAAPGDAATSMRAVGDACNFATSSGDWNTPANWSCGHVPGAPDQVGVGSGQTVQIAAAALAGDLTLSGGTIQFMANVGLDTGTLSVTVGTITGAGTISTSGHFSKTTAGQLTITDTTLMLADPAPTGTELAGGGICLNSAGALLELDQEFTIAAGADSDAFDCSNGLVKIDAAGRLDSAVAGTVSISTPVQDAGTVAVPASQVIGFAGGLNVVTGGAVTVNGTVTGTTTLTGGGLLNGGGQTGSVVNTSGTVAPGASPGTLTVGGDYTQGAGGTLTEEITGTSPGTQFDRLLVSGNVTLDGTLAIQSGGFTPAPTDTFRIVDGATSRTGTFATVTGASVPPNSYAVEYGAASVTLLVLGSPPTYTAPPSIPTTGHPGDLITCNPGTWTRTPTFAFAWSRDGTPIAGQTFSTYTLVDSDLAHMIRCTVTAHDIGGDSNPADSNALSVIPFAPANTAAPSIPASGRPGDVITCSPGTWTGSPTFTFAWTSDGTPIGGQTAQTYTLAVADPGHTIRCRVTAHNAGGDSAPVDSNALAAVVLAPTNTATPTIPATGHTGDEVVCSPGGWTGSPTFTFAWTRDGTLISGQTGSTYTLADVDAGHTIRCRVTAHNGGGDAGPVDSNALGAKVAVAKNTAPPSIPGNGRPGDVVRCNPGTWTGAPTFTYAWLRNDVAVSGQTARTYTITATDVSQQIKCRVTAHNAGGDSAPANSNALGVVKSSAAGPCLICILGAASHTNLTASGSGSITARGGGISINGKARVSGKGKITATNIGMFPRASKASNFSPRPVALKHAVADPFASRATPSVTSACRATPHSAANVTLQPGVYCGLDRQSRQVTLKPGLYVFTGAIHLGEKASLHGDGVTIYLKGRHGSVALSSHAVLDVTAPASGRYRGLAVYFDRGDNGSFQLSGEATAAVGGAMYGAHAGVRLSGDAALTVSGSALAVASLARSGSSRVLVRSGV